MAGRLVGLQPSFICCTDLEKPFAESLPPTEQLGDRHASRQEADEAVQCHQG